MLITAKQLDEKIKNDPAGAYLFYGEEEYLKHYWLEVMRKNLSPDPSFAVFNHIKIDGGDIDRLKDELGSLPMLGMFGGESIKLIEVRDIDFSKLTKNALEDLCASLHDTGDNAVVIYTLPDELPEGTRKKPSAQLKALSDVCSAVSFERQPPARLTGWLSKHFASHGCSADDDTCRFMIDYCTSDMYILSSEAEKLCAYAKAHGINNVDIPTVRAVASPSRVFGSFDLSNALLNGNFPSALAATADMKRQKEKPEVIMSQIIRTFDDLVLIRSLAYGGMGRAEIASALKINDYVMSLRYTAAMRYSSDRLGEILAACAEADKDIKSSPVNKYYVIEELLLGLAPGAK